MKTRSTLLMIGMALAAMGSILIIKPFEHEPLWAQWLLGSALFYVGLPLAIVGAAIYFIGNPRAPKDRLPPPAHGARNRSA
jgi:hypothetical protein